MRVVVIGGGASGTLTALALRRAAVPVVLISDADPGPGLAYRTPEPYHLLNSRAATMSAHPEHPDHFTRWLTTPTAFPARRRYGAYLADTLSRAAVDHRPDRAVAVRPASAGGAVVDLADGHSVRATAVILATGHTAPVIPRAAAPVATDRRYVNDPWSPGALAATGYAGPVLLIGTGLTAIDVAMTIHRHNPDAVIHAVSRHGLLPTHHTETHPDSWSIEPPAGPVGAIPEARCPETAVAPSRPALDSMPPRQTPAGAVATPGQGGDWLPGDERWPATVRELLALVRRSVAEAAAEGRDWRCVVDGLRVRADRLWELLPVSERRRFVRHVDRYWQVCRHRMAPPVARALDTMLAAGTLRPVAANVVGFRTAPSGLRAELRTRRGEDLILHCGTVVNCTGPGSPATGADPLTESLRRTGLARLNALATGFDCDRTGALLGQHGQASAPIWAVGPIRRGATWETTAIPEIRAQAATVAAVLAARRPRPLPV